MSTLSPTRSAHEIALRAWIKAVMSPRFDTASHVVPVAYSDQSAPRQVKPYVTLLILTDRGEGGEDEVVNTWIAGDSRLERTIQRFTAGTVSVTAFGSTTDGDTHGAMIRRLVLSISDADILTLNRAAGLAVRNSVAGARRLSTISHGVVEDRTVIDFAFAYTSSDVFATDADYIETVTADATFLDP